MFLEKWAFGGNVSILPETSFFTLQIVYRRQGPSRSQDCIPLTTQLIFTIPVSLSLAAGQPSDPARSAAGWASEIILFQDWRAAACGAPNIISPLMNNSELDQYKVGSVEIRFVLSRRKKVPDMVMWRDCQQSNSQGKLVLVFKIDQHCKVGDKYRHEWVCLIIGFSNESAVNMLKELKC